MKDTLDEEKKNKRKGLVISVGIHALILLLFFFTIAWRMPNPPPKGIEGAEINLGFVDAGSGDEQANVEQVSEERPSEPQEEIIKEDVLNEEKFVSSDVESDYKVKEDLEKKDAKKEKTETAKEKKDVSNPNNEYKSKSQSDGDKDVKGDQGKPHGNPDSRNYYTEGKGTKGSGPDATGGGLLNLPGWVFDYIPKDPDLSSESGYVVFQFKINEAGKVESVKKIEDRNLSPTTIEFYRKKLLTSTFKPKNANSEPENGETGTLRINIKAK